MRFVTASRDIDSWAAPQAQSGCLRQVRVEYAGTKQCEPVERGAGRLAAQNFLPRTALASSSISDSKQGEGFVSAPEMRPSQSDRPARNSEQKRNRGATNVFAEGENRVCGDEAQPFNSFLSSTECNTGPHLISQRRQHVGDRVLMVDAPRQTSCG
jgi:hypothetical protein